MSPVRFHVLGIPHTVTTLEYSACAFTQKVVKLCRMLCNEGHTVIHYGNEASNVACTEHVTVTTTADLEASYPDHDWRVEGFPAFSKSDFAYGQFLGNSIREITMRKQPGDFLLCAFGDWHRGVADAHKDMIVVESGIGYPNGYFAPFKIWESYAIMHAYQGTQAAVSATNDFWYDKVIPNAFDLDQFTYNADKQNYFLFLGRIGDHKGVHIAKDIARRTKTGLIVAGQGECKNEKYVKAVGVVSPEQRRQLLSNAKAVICASTFLEPFCGVQIEAMASGTPVISTDRGAFAEYNIHGQTGFRCSTFEQFEWAVRNIETIHPRNCQAQAERFAMARIAPMYTEYFKSVKDIFGGKGFYEPHPDRTSLIHTSF